MCNAAFWVSSDSTMRESTERRLNVAAAAPAPQFVRRVEKAGSTGCHPGRPMTLRTFSVLAGPVVALSRRGSSKVIVKRCGGGVLHTCSGFWATLCGGGVGRARLARAPAQSRGSSQQSVQRFTPRTTSEHKRAELGRWGQSHQQRCCFSFHRRQRGLRLRQEKRSVRGESVLRPALPLCCGGAGAPRRGIWNSRRSPSTSPAGSSCSTQLPLLRTRTLL